MKEPNIQTEIEVLHTCMISAEFNKNLGLKFYRSRSIPLVKVVRLVERYDEAMAIILRALDVAYEREKQVVAQHIASQEYLKKMEIKKWKDAAEFNKEYDKMRKENEFFLKVFLAKSSEGGKKSKRPPDPNLMKSAIRAVLKIKAEMNYKNYTPFRFWTRQRLYEAIRKKGFKGTLSWVKKHFATITTPYRD